MIGWLPHSDNPVYAGVRFRCLYPMRTLRAMGLATEIVDLSRLNRYKTVLVQELISRQDNTKPFPTGDAILPVLARMRDFGIRIVLDVCDNHFYYEREDSAWRRANAVFLEMVRFADRVVFSTEELSRQLLKIFPKTIPHTIIGDMLELEADLDDAGWVRHYLSPRRWAARFKALDEIARLRHVKAQGGTNLVWFGAAGSSNATGGMDSLRNIKGVLADLAAEGHLLHLSVISNNEQKFHVLLHGFPVPTSYIEWDRTTFLGLLRCYDLCVIPIEINPFTIVKSNNRLLTALHCGLPIVADRIPSFEEFGDCVVLDDWSAGLRSYITDETRRRRDVCRGREIILNRWTHERIGSEWASVLSE